MIVALVAMMVFCYTCQSLFTKLYSAHYTGKDAALATPVFSICFGAFIGLGTLIIGGFSFSPSWYTVLYGALNAVMLLLYNTSLIKAGEKGSYSFLMICNMFGAIIVPLVVSALFLNETITVRQGIAIAMMLISFVVMNVRSISFKGASGAYYLWCALLFMANGLYSTFMNVQQKTMASMSLPSQRTEMLAIVYLGMALSVLVAQFAKGGFSRIAKGFQMGKKSAMYVLGCCVVATIAANLLLYLLNIVPSNVLFTIDNGGVLVLSVLCSFILFKERPTWEQYIGIALAVISIVMISL